MDYLKRHITVDLQHLTFWLLASLLLLGFLGSREIWTQEWRWGEIVRTMLLHHDYFHPTLANQTYFDKPLLSYWLMVAVSKLTGQFSTWTIRFPSAIAGLISIGCLYQIGRTLQDRKVASIAAIMLATTYYFIFWARTASTDILNLAGILSAVAWYFSKCESPGLVNYSVFFILLALTALLKGLIAPVLILLIILPHAALRFKLYCQWQLFIGLLLAIFVYFLPFWITSLETHMPLAQSGLYEVYRENILRFFVPFDHKDPVYTYFLYLPVYLLPWTAFFLPAIYQLPKRWSTLSLPTKQIAMTNVGLFIFLTLSGSRRSYYILPMVPFAILLTAEWIRHSKKRIKLAYFTAALSFLVLFSWFLLFQPLYYSNGGLSMFSQQLIQLTSQTPEKIWRVAFLDVDNRLSFYLPQDEITFLRSDKVNVDLNTWLKKYDILITRETHLNQIKNGKDHLMLFTQSHRGDRWLHHRALDTPVAIFSERYTRVYHPNRLL